MYILGVYTGHTGTAALLKDGRIISCVSEERFNGIKNYLGFPKEAIKWCLADAGIKASELETVILVGLYGAPIHSAAEKQKRFSLFSIAYNIVGSIRRAWRWIVYYVPVLRPIGRVVYRLATKTLGKKTVEKEKQFLADFLGIQKSKVLSADHHLLHAVTAYYASPYNQEKALLLTLDAEGDQLSSTVSIFNSRERKQIAATGREQSLGWLFLYLTQYLGMKPMEHEYKVMGLAPYAKDVHMLKVYEKIKDIVTLDPKNPLTFRSKFNTTDSLRYLKKEMVSYRFDNIAGAFQKLLEDRMVEWVKAAVKETGLHTVIFSGGAFMNVKANMKIAALPEVKQSFFMPSAGDESLPIGACYWGYLKATDYQGKIEPITDLYLGSATTNEEIEVFLEKGGYKKKYNIEKRKDIESDIASLLAKGEVVARFAGRMEWGARSLGNRAILANPQDPDVVMIINEQMKDRDFWMPFAPSILAERMDDYCINPKHLEAPYMIVSFDSTPLARKELRAAMHPYDFTLRPQAVYETWNPRYYKVIKEFEKRTGIGGVLNTSFNLHGLPIVKGPKEAMYAFEHSGLQYLAIENYLISKN